MRLNLFCKCCYKGIVVQEKLGVKVGEFVMPELLVLLHVHELNGQQSLLFYYNFVILLFKLTMYDWSEINNILC
jgi:hypothetical protein